MKKPKHSPFIINSISELHRLLALPKPEHPLVSLINFDDVKTFSIGVSDSLVYNFYSICTKKGYTGKMKYGQSYYDFDEGMMSFFSPGQVITADNSNDQKVSGWWLIIHPDFIRNYALSKTIKTYGFFSYAVSEALHLSDKEEKMISSLMDQIRHEYQSVIDAYSQNVIVSQIELLLNYADRFYNRQFITRKTASNELLVRIDEWLTDYFNNEAQLRTGLPTVQLMSEQLGLSSHYLSDMLRSLTGQNTQQHIHHKLIEKAKEKLATTTLSVSEIAYQLGFEYPQSFNKLFKSKTDVSPLEYRHSFN